STRIPWISLRYAIWTCFSTLRFFFRTFLPFKTTPPAPVSGGLRVSLGFSRFSLITISYSRLIFQSRTAALTRHGMRKTAGSLHHFCTEKKDFGRFVSNYSISKSLRKLVSVYEKNTESIRRFHQKVRRFSQASAAGNPEYQKDPDEANARIPD